jgi:hypothetical protein
MVMRTRFSNQLLSIAWIAMASGGFAPGVAGAAEGARVTAVVGTAQQGGDPALEKLSGVAEDKPLETQKEGGCSILLEEDALVEVCGDSKISLRKRTPGGPRVLDVGKGTVKVSAEKRIGDERIEIHTPAAIATILGTVVFVSVDALGVTTITSEVSRVMVSSSDPKVGGSTLLTGGQQLVIEPGERPSTRPQTIDPKTLATLGGCLVDFHSVALASDRDRNLTRSLDALAEIDTAAADLPEVASLGPGVGEVQDLPPGSDPTGGNGVYTPTQGNPDVREDVFEMVDEPGPPDDGPGPCPPGIPGDQCGPF